MQMEEAKIRFRSVRKKPTSFSGWRESVKQNADVDDKLLKDGTKLWKVRRKAFKGLVCYQRTFTLDVDSLCVKYARGGNKGDICSIDVADVVEVRRGFATDTFNEAEKRKCAFKIAEFLNAENCFSVIFAPRLKRKSLDLVARDAKTASAWIGALGRLVNAAKNVEIQKEYELYLRNQFHAADANRSGSLTVDEFSGLLRQLNVHLTADEIARIFDECNTDHTPEKGNKQVIDEHEFLEFYHSFLQRDELVELFQRYAVEYDGLAMTVAELRTFLVTEQDLGKVSDAECELMIAEFEPSNARRRQKLLSAEGFARFFLFSDLHDIIDHSKTDSVYQVSLVCLFTFFVYVYSRIPFEGHERVAFSLLRLDVAQHLFSRQSGDE